MKYFAPVLFIALLNVSHHSVAQEKVDAKGIASKIKLEEVVYGHLNELNGKFKFRVSEISFAPGGHLGAHHHVGPGIRFVASGKLTFVQAGKATVYKTGDYFYETGNVVHTAYNKTGSPVRIIFFEIIPAQWEGPTAIPPKL